MKRIILTGFEPFGPYPCNPVEESTRHFNGMTIGEYEIVGVVLRCTYLSAFETLRLIIDAQEPDAIIETGLSSSVKGIRFETTGKNSMNGKYPDADKSEPKGVPILQNGPEFLYTNGDSSRLANYVHEQGIPTELSADAGEFVCNSLLYLTANYRQQMDLNFKQLFIHTPWTDAYADQICLEEGKMQIPQEMLHTAIELLIRNIEP